MRISRRALILGGVPACLALSVTSRSLLAAVNSGRFKVHAESADPAANEVNDLRRELLRQCEVAEYAMRANQVMSFFVPEHRGHDDVLNAAALVVAAKAKHLAHGVELAQHSIDSGEAEGCLDRLIAVSNG